ncbi:hypothetical protein Tco_1331052 [Tanacetum coccineum]
MFLILPEKNPPSPSQSVSDVNRRVYDGVFIGATQKDLAILFLMYRVNEGSLDGLFERWVDFDDENTYPTEQDLRHRISHLQQRYFLNLDREIIASTSDRALDAFVLSDNMWGVFAHAPVDTEAFIETLPDKVRRIQSAPRFHRD